MDQQALAQQMLSGANAARFVSAVTDMTAALPHPDGPTIRITMTRIADGKHLQDVDIDVTNLWDLAQHAHHKADRARDTAPAPAPTSKSHLRLVGGAA
ncbi:hypothetical protein [Streptomyces sp. NPDC007991]|uniref:hypothetical protein n=1 Tax=Streptomyces sp. NPDC007991 TaxID=3364803 RepID=UPI0036ED4640